MACEPWSLTSKLCDSCKTTPPKLFCLTESSFLCSTCDNKIHAPNKQSSRHARVSVCEVCEQAPAAVTCKADAAALCTTCDHDIHAANPLARRHERVPVTPFSGASVFDPKSDEYSEEEEEAASWILPDPNSKIEEDSEENMFNDDDMHPYLDLDLMCGGEQKQDNQVTSDDHHHHAERVVPGRSDDGFGSGQVVDGYPSYDVEYQVGAKPFMYNFTSQSISHSVSS